MRIIDFPGNPATTPSGVAYVSTEHEVVKNWLARCCWSVGSGSVSREFVDSHSLARLMHGDVVEYAVDVQPHGYPRPPVVKTRDYCIVLAPEGAVPMDAPTVRLVLCDSAEQACRLARAIQSGDRRARSYLPGGPALSPELELPRYVPAPLLDAFPPIDRIRDLPSRVMIIVDGKSRPDDAELLPCPRIHPSGQVYIGCISRDQQSAVYARGLQGCGLKRHEIDELCRVEFKVPEVAQLRRHFFRDMMDDVLPRHARSGFNPHDFKRPTPAQQFWKSARRIEAQAEQSRQRKAAGL